MLETVEITFKKNHTMVGRCLIGSMYVIFTYIDHTNQPNVGKYNIHVNGSYGYSNNPFSGHMLVFKGVPVFSKYSFK